MNAPAAITTQLFTGAAIAPCLPDLARLRMTVFRAWPYLYDGSHSFESGYMANFAASASAGLVMAFRDGEAVGASSCIRLAEEEDHITAPFRDAGIDIGGIFYFGESVLLPACRGQGIGVAFFDAREAHARTFPGITTAAFCAVERPDNHPLRPAGAVPLDEFWRKRGFARTDLRCTMAWKQIDTPDQVTNTLRFWTKSLQ